MAWRGNTPKPIINKPPNKINSGPEMSGMKKEATGIVGPPVFGPEANQNRAYNLRRDTDDRRDFSVKLIDIDATILSYMDTVISPTIVDAGRQVKVPINYASPERWKAIRKDGALRDKNGKIQCPAIAFRRSTVQRNDSLITFNRYLQYPVIRKFSEKNKYDKFSVMVNPTNKQQEIYSVAMPDHIIVNYEFIVWTDLVEQGNAIIEAINFSTEDYWGDKNRYKFRTSISDYNFETMVDAGQDRAVRATFSMMCYAYLLPDKYENYKSTVQKAFTIKKVVFGANESTIDIKDLSSAELTKTAEDLMKTGAVTFAPDIKPTKPGFGGIIQNANYSINAGNAAYSDYAVTASYINLTGIEGTFNEITLVGGGATGSFATNIVSGVNADSGSFAIDSIPTGAGNAARWLVSVNDGDLNFKTTEVVASWNNYAVKFNNTEVNQIGSVPVHMSVSNVVSGSVSLVATPLSGTWTLKMIRMMI